MGYNRHFEGATEWTTIPEFPHYSVSSTGRVRNDQNNHILHPSPTSHGSYAVSLMRDGFQYKRSVAVLVAEAYIPYPESGEDGLEADTPVHINGRRDDASANNLLWTTRSSAINYHRYAKDALERGEEPIPYTAPSWIY